MPPCRYIPEAVLGQCPISEPTTTTVVAPEPVHYDLPRTGGSSVLVVLAVVFVGSGSSLRRLARR